ncbi:MAG: hypothetical protein ABI304_01985 [Rudaea sp.]
MTTPKTRGAAIGQMCRGCIYDPAAAGTWREQVATCCIVDCPLWRFRPMPRTPPHWIASRVPADLPEGWASLPHDEAIRRIRNLGAKPEVLPDSAAVHAHDGALGTLAVMQASSSIDTPAMRAEGSQSAMGAPT